MSPIKFIYLEKRNVLNTEIKELVLCSSQYVVNFDFVRSNLVKYLSNRQLKFLTGCMSEQVQFRE